MSNEDKDLEIEKLRNDLAKAKITSRYQLLIAFFSTFLVSVIGSYLVFVEHTTKNEQTFDDGHREFISKFVDIAIDDDIERRQRLARYFASVTLDEIQKARWEEYAEYVEKIVDKNPAEIARLKANLGSVKESERETLKARIKFLEKQLGASRERANVQTKSSVDCIAMYTTFPEWSSA